MHTDQCMRWRLVFLLALLAVEEIATQQTKVEDKEKSQSSRSQTSTEDKGSNGSEDRPKKTTAEIEEILPLAKSEGCPKGCALCHEDHCFSCLSDFRRINYACAKKGCSDPQCTDCSSDVCYKCIEGYAPNMDGYCSWTGPSGCEDKNCMICAETRIACTECASGYQLKSNRCYKKACKDKNCLRCNADGTVCDLCKERFQSRLGECLDSGCLDDHCRQCSPSGGSCYRCNDGYHVDSSDGLCKQCPDTNCINCGGFQLDCLNCVSGYYVGRVNSGRIGCVECGKAISHCLLCSRNGQECHQCDDGHYLEHGHCIPCPTDCAECKSPWLCDMCQKGFVLRSNGLCKESETTAAPDNGMDHHGPLMGLMTAGFAFIIVVLFT